MLTEKEANSKHVRNYYEDLGRAHDYLLRCKDCQRLVGFDQITKLGNCKCGNRRFSEITTLSGWEWFLIRVGIIRFDGRKEFIKEFSRVQA